MKTFLVITLCLSSNVCLPQIVEQFSDGDFTSSPQWSGSASQYVVNPAQQLQLNNTVGGTSYLSTAFEATSLEGFEWQVFVRQSFSSSASNYGRIYLVSSQANLTGPLNGYYLQLGEAGSNDAVELFKQAGTVHTSICRAANAMIASSFSIRIRVKTYGGHWSLSVDYTGGTTFVEQAQGTDLTFTSSGYLGVVCVYTAANATRFFFDDIIAGPPLGDLAPPELTSATVLSSTELLLGFSEAIDPLSGSDPTNFEASHGLGSPVAALISADQKSIKLTFSSGFLNGRLYSLSLVSIWDLALNEMPPHTFSFRYFNPEPGERGDIVFNELLSDPSPAIGLPAHEFVEIFNNSQKAFDLSNWKLGDLTSTATLPGVFILPGEYVIVIASAALESYRPYGSTIALSDMPTLNNSFDALVLRDPSGRTIDSLRYSLSWFQDEDKQQGGYTLERLGPSLPTNEPLNWTASVDSTGGTPGSPNSVLGRNPDSKPPFIDTLVVVGQSEVMICFSEPVDSISSRSAAAYVLEAGLMPVEVRVTGDQCIKLRFTSPFRNGISNNLHVTAVKDIAGNEMRQVVVTFLYFMPGEVRPGAVLINEIMADPTPTVNLPEAEFIEIVNTTPEPYDLGGWTLGDAITVATLPPVIILPHEHMILTSTSNAGKFHSSLRTVAVIGFPSLANSGEPLALKAQGITIDSLYYRHEWLGTGEKSDGGWSLERLSLTVHSNESTNWRASVDSLGGTPGRVNSVAGMNPDSHPPELDSLFVRSSHELELYLSEPIEPTTRDDVRNYEWSGEQPAEVAAAGIGERLLLRFATAFPNGLDQKISVSGLRDTAGNVMAVRDVPFIYFKSGPVVRGAVLINEIMSDPAPVVQLPEAEFIEIVNNSELPYDLSKWTLSDGTTTVVLPQVILRPAEFLVLTSTSNELKFADSVLVAGVTGFPSLNNSGEPLALRAGGTLIDSVRYDLHWFGNDPKQDGGWSLERLRYNYASHSEINWRPSVHPHGGTPGWQNSQFGINPDDKSPMVVSAIAATAHLIALTFDEPLSPASPVSVTLDSIPCHRIEWRNGQEAHIVVDEALVNGRSYRLSVTGVQDTARNLMPATELVLRYFVPSYTRYKDVIITEIMVDPSPPVGLPEAEYVELYNRSESPLSLLGWHLADERSATELPDRIVMPGEYVVLTSSQVREFSGRENVIVTVLPSLANEGEHVVLRSHDGRQIDSVSYSPQWLGIEEKKEGGWALELIDPRNPCGEEHNWTASEDDSGGTPGRQNSVYASKPDLAGPRLLGVTIESKQSVLALFDENLAGAISAESFSLVPDPGTLLTEFDGASLRRVRITLSTDLKLSTPYRLTASKLYDCNGNLIDGLHSFTEFVVPEQPAEGEVVINEVLFNPRPGGPDFIEIYNQGPRYIDLNGWRLVRLEGEVESDAAFIDTGTMLVPHSFRVFTTDLARLQSDYPMSVASNVAEVGLPSMPDDRAGIAVIDSRGGMIDRVEYDERLHSTLIRDPEGVSLERISSSAGSLEESNWVSASEASGFATPGFRNSSTRDDTGYTAGQFSVSPELISSNGTGRFAMISYHFDEPGYMVSCRILDQQGRPVREVANNLSVGLDGFLRWDADRDDGSAARPGYYVVWIGYFNLTGQSRSARIKVVISPG